MTNYANEISGIVRAVASNHRRIAGRGSESKVVPTLRTALNDAGFNASQKYRLAGPISLGRIPKTGAPSKQIAWAEADIAVYRDHVLVGIIESEHDLAWVRRNGDDMPGSSGASTYTMSSIALDANGDPFDSYGPLERMAFIVNWKGDATSTAQHLHAIRSNAPADHNPAGLPLFLVVEVPDEKSRVLEPRLQSLGAVYVACGDRNSDT